MMDWHRTSRESKTEPWCIGRVCFLSNKLWPPRDGYIYNFPTAEGRYFALFCFELDTTVTEKASRTKFLCFVLMVTLALIRFPAISTDRSHQTRQTCACCDNAWPP